MVVKVSQQRLGYSLPSPSWRDPPNLHNAARTAAQIDGRATVTVRGGGIPRGCCSDRASTGARECFSSGARHTPRSMAAPQSQAHRGCAAFRGVKQQPGRTAVG